MKQLAGLVGMAVYFGTIMHFSNLSNTDQWWLIGGLMLSNVVGYIEGRS